jgi:hypothetical protein
MSLAFERIRLQISNTFGGTDLTITAASIALPRTDKPGVNNIHIETLKALTFSNGSPSITIPKGKVAYTDPLDFYKIAAQSTISVSLYLKNGQSGTSITGHPGSRTTSWMATGNKVNETDVAGASTKHWYFISAVEAWVPSNYSALVILGDSITDGRGSTDDGNNR